MSGYHKESALCQCVECGVKKVLNLIIEDGHTHKDNEKTVATCECRGKGNTHGWPNHIILTHAPQNCLIPIEEESE